MKGTDQRRISALSVYAAFYLTFLFAPLVVIALFSFHSSPALSLPFHGFSLRWYQDVLSSGDFRTALLNSTKVAIATTALTSCLGTFAALAFTRLGQRGRGAVSFLAFLPIALPGLFIGLSLLTFFSIVGRQLSLSTVVIAHVVYTLPFFVLVARARVERFDPALEEAARDLGAGPFQAFRLVVLPLVAPALIGAAILSFALSFDEFIITFFVIGNDPTLPVLIWSALRRSITPSVNAVSTLLLLISLACLVIAILFLREGRHRHRRMRRPGVTR